MLKLLIVLMQDSSTTNEIDLDVIKSTNHDVDTPPLGFTSSKTTSNTNKSVGYWKRISVLIRVLLVISIGAVVIIAGYRFFFMQFLSEISGNAT